MTAMRRTALVLSAALSLGIVGRAAAGDPPAGAEPAIPPATEEIPAGIPIALDGIVSSGEWDDAAVASFESPSGPALRVKQARGTLLVSVATDRPWPAMGRFALYTRPGRDPGAWDDRGAAHLDFEPTEHDRPHAMLEVKGESAWERKDALVVVRAAGLASRASFEVAIPLSALGVVGKTPPPLRWLAVWATPFGPRPSWTIPASLELNSALGATPKDLASSARWATATKWVEPGGAGAWSRAEWEAFVAADREIAERGTKAHALALRLRDGEYGSAEGRPEARKIETEIRRDLLENLRWIATKEPWTPTDVRAVAAGHWKSNRYAEALALLEASIATRRDGSDRGADWDLVGRIAMDAERYDEASTAYERLADALPANQAPPYRAEAARARSLAKEAEAEALARAEDAAKSDLPIARVATSKGDFWMRLLEDDAPDAVAQLVHLAEASPTKDGKAFYAGTLFHRVLPNLFAQGGDPTSREKGCAGEGVGSGGSEWWIPAEQDKRHRPFRGAVAFALDHLSHVRGQFFVMTAGRPGFGEGTYPVFGTVVSGMDVIDRIEACDEIVSISILNKRPHEYVVNPCGRIPRVW